MIGKKDVLGIAMAIFVVSSSISINLLTIDHGIDISYKVVLDSTHARIEDARTLVITDNETWYELWLEIYHVNGPPPPILYVNFTNEWLIVVSLGTRNHGGYVLNITSITRALLCYKVFYIEIDYGGGTMSETYPLQVAKVTGSPADLPVSFFYTYSGPVIIPET